MDQSAKLKAALKAEIRKTIKESLELGEAKATMPELKNGFKQQIGFTSIKVKDGKLMISHNGNQGNSVEGSVDPNLKRAGFPTIKELKKKFKVVEEDGSPDYSWGIVFDIKSGIKEHQGTLMVNGKPVKTYKQNGDSSYNVVYDDGTKATIYSSDPDGSWDKINDLRKSATGSVNELARVANVLKIGNLKAAQAYAEANKGKWVSDMVLAVIKAGTDGITQPALAAAIGKGSQQTINPKVRELIAAGVFTQGESGIKTATPKQEPWEKKADIHGAKNSQKFPGNKEIPKDDEEFTDDFEKSDASDDAPESEEDLAKKATPAKGVQNDASKLDDVLKKMKDLAAQYKSKKGTPEGDAIVAKLKDLNKEKSKLEKLVKAALGDDDEDEIEPLDENENIPEEKARLKLNNIAKEKGLKNYFIDRGTDSKTQNDILVLLDLDHDGVIVAKATI